MEIYHSGHILVELIIALSKVYMSKNISHGTGLMNIWPVSCSPLIELRVFHQTGIIWKYQVIWWTKMFCLFIFRTLQIKYQGWKYATQYNTIWCGRTERRISTNDSKPLKTVHHNLKGNAYQCIRTTGILAKRLNKYKVKLWYNQLWRKHGTFYIDYLKAGDKYARGFIRGTL